MRLWFIALAIAMFPALLVGQSPDGGRTTRSGVYNRDQVARGQDVYLGQCRSCHAPESHASATFQAAWNGKSLVELYNYIRERMPKSEPGSLTDQEYVDVLSYLLRLNRMPEGDAELPSDTLTLKRIRFDVVAPIPVRKEP